MTVRAAVVLAASCLTLGFLLGLNVKWEPFDRKTWGEHMANLRRVTAERLALWTAILALLIAAWALAAQGFVVQRYSSYIDCRAELDQANAVVNERRRVLLNEVLIDMRQVARAATEGGATEPALNDLESSSSAFVRSSVPEPPHEECGNPED